MIQNGQLLIGGNSILLWFGTLLIKFSEFLIKKGNEFIYKGTKRIITNPEASWINAFSIIYTFTVDGTSKYQLILESTEYKDRYKEDNQSVNLTEEEKFIVIRENQKQWFHRN